MFALVEYLSVFMCVVFHSIAQFDKFTTNILDFMVERSRLEIKLDNLLAMKTPESAVKNIDLLLQLIKGCFFTSFSMTALLLLKTFVGVSR